MKISRISVYQTWLSVPGGGYQVSKGRSSPSYNATIVVIDTDAGITGVGESCPMGANYLPAFPDGVRAGMVEIAPHLLGQDPRRLSQINMTMDAALMGHPYIKSPVDIACWDILGKSVGLPIYELMGGRLVDRVPIRIGIPTSDIPRMTQYFQRKHQQGFTRFNMKAGDNPDKDIQCARLLVELLQEGEILVIDANGGWRLDEAIYVVRSLSDLKQLYFEQPCATYEDCLELRRRTECRIMLDECITDFHALMRAYQDGAAEAFTFKINRAGGITKTRLVRDVCVELGILVTIQDSWGSQLMDAAIAQLCHSMPERYLIGGWCSSGHVEECLVTTGPEIVEGHLVAADLPGIGVELDFAKLGEPVSVFE